MNIFPGDQLLCLQEVKLFTVPNGLGPNLLSLVLKVYSRAGNHVKIVNQ